MRTAARYVLFQLPGWYAVATGLVLLRSWFDAAPSTLWLVAAAWAAKDAVMYRFVRAAYAVDERSEVEKLVGETAVVCRAVAPDGYVRLRHERWHAEAAAPEELPIEEGAQVRVVSARGLTLKVRRLTL